MGRKGKTVETVAPKVKARGITLTLELRCKRSANAVATQGRARVFGDTRRKREANQKRRHIERALRGEG